GMADGTAVRDRRVDAESDGDVGDRLKPHRLSGLETTHAFGRSLLEATVGEQPFKVSIYRRNAIATNHVENRTASQSVVPVAPGSANDLRQTSSDEFTCKIACELGNATDIGDTSWGHALALPHRNKYED
ncbi:MAG: hypothetical protein M3Y72_02095, partial [Acidobacteriota bacterium]|nr:hypothetical protein [Acidobacteriota bacterium]